MDRFFAWCLDNPVYAAAPLLGFILGLLYGLDGWRGAPTEGELKESPRVKNLIWLLGVAFVTSSAISMHWREKTQPHPSRNPLSSFYTL
jgi:hypothetical protein